ncbi:MAG: hypothetical protein U0Y82_00460 [Thermoleophilia bacterium]
MGCTGQVLTPALLPFGDINLYTLAPQGGFEGRTDGWTVRGAARVVADPGYPRGPVIDTTSMELAPGATAVSPPICASAITPTFRVFLKALSAGAGAATIDVSYPSATGATEHDVISVAAGSGAWALSPILRVDTRKIAVDRLGWGRIRIAVTAPSNSALRLDDLFVDPKMR